MESASSGKRFGRYLLEERIAFGGMAEIFRARYQAGHDFEKVVVIKRILPHLSMDPEFVTLFRDEALLTVRLSHANCVQVFDFGKEGSDYFLAMEYVNGRNLRQVMQQFRAQNRARPEVPIQLALFVALEAAKGLAHAHSRTDDAGRNLGIIHRDVTPSNILVSFEGEVKVADFGIAKAASRRSEATQVGKVRGKAAFFAPEQLRGDPVDARVDQFALGNVLWEMLTGRCLVDGATEAEIMDRILKDEEFPPPSVVNPNVPADVDRVVSRAIRRNREERFESTEELVGALNHLVARNEVNASYVRDVMKELFRRDLVVPPVPVPEPEPEPEPEPIPEESTASTASGKIVDEPKGTRRLEKPIESVAHVEPVARVPAPPIVSRRGLLAAGVLAIVTALGIGFGARPPATSTVVTRPTGVPVTAAPTATAMAAVTAAVTDARIPTATATTARAVPATPTTQATAVVATAAGSGRLSIDSRPWGEIYLDGRRTGRQTPAFDMVVPAGTHEVRIVNPDQQLEIRFSIAVKAGEHLRKGTLTLAPVNR